MITIQKTFIPKYKSVEEKYEGGCPNCSFHLVHTEASFFCPECGFSEYDFDLEKKELFLG